MHHSSGCLLSTPSGSSCSYFCNSVLATSKALAFSPALGLKVTSKYFLILYVWVEGPPIVLVDLLFVLSLGSFLFHVILCL